MVHFTYQTKNFINNKTYIGVHSTKNPNDKYLGSGTYLKAAFKKYDKENFKCIPLCYFDTRKEAQDEETWLVNQEWVDDRTNYNAAIGGQGGSTSTVYTGWRDKPFTLEGIRFKNTSELMATFGISKSCAKRWRRKGYISKSQKVKAKYIDTNGLPKPLG